MRNLTQKELININGGDNPAAFYAGRQFAEDVYNAAGEVVHGIGDFFRGVWDAM
jgi:hypothetical protein